MDDAVGIKNAFNESYTHMRRSLAVRLLENIANNTKHQDILKFFELGKVYTKEGETSVFMREFLENTEENPFFEKKMLA
jgi:phenylalanyl-tRNA synthetase beta subunit